MSNQHIHHKEIKAWADGKTIEFFGQASQSWMVIKKPTWSLTSKYRVSPMHSHQALMDQYAKGNVQIEIFTYANTWQYVENPKWNSESVYRIREYDEGAFYYADYKGYRGIALRWGKGWKFIAPNFTGSYHVSILTVHRKVMD